MTDPELIKLSDRVKIPEGILIREVAGEAVLVNLNTERYFGLNSTGTRMWTALAAGRSIQEGIDILLEEYDVDRETITRDMLHLIQDLIRKGLLDISVE